MYSAHNSAAISQPALSLSSPTLLHAVFGMKNPLLINTEFKCQIRSDGRCILAVLTTHCTPPPSPCVFVCMCAVFLFFYIIVIIIIFRESREKRSSVLHRRVRLCSQLADCSLKKRERGVCVAPALRRFSGNEETWKRGELEPRVSGRGEWRRIGGFLWSPLSRFEEQSGDQSSLFYVAGANTLKSPSHLQHSLHQVQ